MAPNTIFRFLFRRVYKARPSAKLWLLLVIAGLLFYPGCAPLYAQLSTHAEILEMSRKVAEYENQIRFAFVQKDNKTLDQALISLGEIAPNNDIFRLYTQMKEQRQKKSKPSPYHALLPRSVMTTETTPASGETSLPEDLQAMAISMVETGAPTATLIAETAAPVPPIAGTESLSTETISPAQPLALGAGEPTPLPATASPAVQPMPEPAPMETVSPLAGATESITEQPAFMRMLRNKAYWIPALILALLVILIPILAKILRRPPEASPPTFGSPGSSIEKTSSQETALPEGDAEVHLRDIVVKLQGDGREKSPTSSPPSASQLKETLSIIDSSSNAPSLETEPLEGLSDEVTLFHSSESTKTQDIQEPARASGDEETLFRSADQTLTQAPDLDDVIRLGDSGIATSETVATPGMATPAKEGTSADSTTPLAQGPGQDDLRLDWAMDEKEKVSPSGLTEAQRKVIFDEAFDRGCAAFERQDYSSAEQQFSIALSLRPNDPEVNSRLTIVRKALGKSS